jgi:hypothetical protein
MIEFGWFIDISLKFANLRPTKSKFGLSEVPTREATRGGVQ